MRWATPVCVRIPMPETISLAMSESAASVEAALDDLLGRPVEAFYADNACKPEIGVTKKPATSLSMLVADTSARFWRN